MENDLTEMVRLLLSRGADPKVATYSGKTVLGLTKEKEMLSLLTGMNDFFCYSSIYMGTFPMPVS